MQRQCLTFANQPMIALVSSTKSGSLSVPLGGLKGVRRTPWCPNAPMPQCCWAGVAQYSSTVGSRPAFVAFGCEVDPPLPSSGLWTVPGPCQAARIIGLTAAHAHTDM